MLECTLEWLKRVGDGSGVQALAIQHEDQVWVPRTHVNVGWAQRTTYNASLLMVKMGDPQSKVASETSHTGSPGFDGETLSD